MHEQSIDGDSPYNSAASLQIQSDGNSVDVRNDSYKNSKNNDDADNSYGNSASSSSGANSSSNNISAYTGDYCVFRVIIVCSFLT